MKQLRIEAAELIVKATEPKWMCSCCGTNLKGENDKCNNCEYGRTFDVRALEKKMHDEKENNEF